MSRTEKIREIEEILYEKAEATGRWAILIARPALLMRWQINHPKNVMQIATIASHRMAHHYFCEKPGSEKCQTVEAFMRKGIIEEIALTIQHHKDSRPQTEIFS